ncbi:translation initiation factor IF-2-like [Phyllostomus discolor]|uniref:Translation initiation factor IF-2-like n=1 Tax=Phyllostomus discolor TaxID=89673 RepID=A0A7E6DHI1_9CHIR|nr:translation initiation factor IF-2-like [Phyllostomus discolor]
MLPSVLTTGVSPPLGSVRVLVSSDSDPTGRETPACGGRSSNPALAQLTDSAHRSLSPPARGSPGNAAETRRSRDERAGASTPLSRKPGPAAPRGDLRPARASTPWRRRPARGPRGPAGARGGPAEGVGCGRRGARRPRPSRHPHPAPHPHPGPGRPRRSPRSGPGWTPVRPPAVAACGRPRGPEVPSPRHPGADPSHPSILCPGPGAGRRIPGLTSERRWQWTRKLDCRCYCSPLGSGESLSLSSKRAKEAGLWGCTRGSSLLQHHYRHCEDITPESRSSALRNDNFPTILEAEERGAGGKSAPAPDKVQISTSHLWEKVHAGRLHQRLGGQAGKKLGVLEKRFHLHQGEICFCIF